MTEQVPVRIPIGCGSRSNQRHLALEDIEESVQLIEAETAQHGPGRRDAFIARERLHRAERVGVVVEESANL